MAVPAVIRRMPRSELHSILTVPVENLFQRSFSAGNLPRNFAVYTSILNRRIPMFEHHQEEMEKLMKENEDFLRIYNRHQELDKRVAAAETGTAPMEDLALNQLKKEKLWAKDKLARIMDLARS